MPLNIGLSGMDPATEAALKAAFAEANEQRSGHWCLLPETQADHIVVDMDSMYGPMSWLRLHAAGKRVIGLTSAARTQTDFRLGRPFSVETLVALLQQIEGVAAPAAAASPSPDSDATPADATPAEAPVPAAMPQAVASPGETVAATSAPLAAASPADTASTPPPAAPPVPPPAPTPAPAAGAAPEPPAAEAATAPTRLFDWLSGPHLRGRLRYRRPSGPTLLIDADARTYHGPATLKPLLPYFDGDVAQADFAPLDEATWALESAAAGAAQPLARLAWLGGLVAGKGRLLPGHDPDARYQLNRWPQTEREFPRHFRIATAMMKGPATLEEIAGSSGIALEEIIDFVNASLATGAAESTREPEPVEAASTKSGGLLSRLRGR